MPAERPIRDLLRNHPVVRTDLQSTVRDAAQRMAAESCPAAVVMEGGKLRGIFTARDLLTRVVAADRDPAMTTMAEVMTADPDTVAPDTSIADALRKLHELGYDHLPVVEGNEVIGMVNASDLLTADAAPVLPELEARSAITENLR